MMREGSVQCRLGWGDHLNIYRQQNYMQRTTRRTLICSKKEQEAPIRVSSPAIDTLLGMRRSPVGEVERTIPTFLRWGVGIAAVDVKDNARSTKLKRKGVQEHMVPSISLDFPWWLPSRYSGRCKLGSNSAMPRMGYQLASAGRCIGSRKSSHQCEA